MEPVTNNQQIQPPNIIQAHFKAESDKYHPINNPNGYVNFGVSVNALNMQTVIQYFPKYITKSDCQYKIAPEEQSLNQILCKGTPYSSNQVFAFGNLVTLLAVHAQHWSKISIQGHYQQIGAVLSYSGCQVVPFEQSNCHFMFYPEKQALQNILKKQENKKILIVVSNPSQILFIGKKNVFYAFQRDFQFGITCGVGLYIDKSLPSQFQDYFIILQFSQFLSATIKHIQYKGLQSCELQELLQIQKEDSKCEIVLKLLESPTHISNLHLTNGAGAALSALAYSLFHKNDLVALDKPFYARFIEDFKKSGIVFQFMDLFSGRIVERVQTAYERGAKGYIICNPHNPTGIVYNLEQVLELCEWAKKHQDFHLILDEIYHYSLHDQTSNLCNTIQYANILSNIHVIRGFAKDFSLCGFKVGYMVSSNETVKGKFVQWSKIIRPHQFVLKAICRMLRLTDQGKKIFIETKKTLQKAFKITLQLLDLNGVKYIQPQGGCFLMIDLRSVLEKTGFSQQQLWKELFFDAKVNTNRGTLYGFQEGFFRVCPVIEDYLIYQGIKRISSLINVLMNKTKSIC